MTFTALLACACAVLSGAAGGATTPRPPHLSAPTRTYPHPSAPSRTQPRPATPTVDSVIVHGNHTTPTEDVLALAGVLVGLEVTDAVVDEVAARLRASGRFAAVEVRRRFVSIADPSRVLLVIVVTEQPGVREEDLTPGPARRLLADTMWLPMLEYQEGYGFTYGARISVVERLGPRSRVSFPLTWGGERQAQVEVERTFDGPAVGRVVGGGGITRRPNPHFDLADTRAGIWARVESAPRSWLRARADTRLARVSFDAGDHRLTTVGVSLVLDTRREPAFPRDAVFVELGVERLGFEARAGAAAAPGANGSAVRRRFDGRAYVGVPGRGVVAVRLQSVTSAAPVPAYERQLLGGIPSLRGSDVGVAAGDNLAAASVEWRMPLGSPRNLARVGVKGFADVGVVYAAGEAVTDQPFSCGYGAGVFLQATVLTLDVDLGWRPGRSRPNAHVQFGVRLPR
jgi:outer membrane protein assembly factor BamA